MQSLALTADWKQFSKKKVSWRLGQKKDAKWNREIQGGKDAIVGKKRLWMLHADKMSSVGNFGGEDWENGAEAIWEDLWEKIFQSQWKISNHVCKSISVQTG